MAYAPHSKENSSPQHQQQSTKATTQIFADERESTTVTSPLQTMMVSSPQQQKLKSIVQLMANSPAQQRLNTTVQSFANKPEPIQRMKDEEPLQAKLESEPAQLEAAAETPRPNNTGLPDNLKSGIENLSGMNMDHVKVHYNSDKPAQLQAHAYAQGSEIHVATGQEQHLPHEAWHVVQQAQGRVRPTVQMKSGLPLNDDIGLESEADVMGARAIQMVLDRQNTEPAPALLTATSQMPIQCVIPGDKATALLLTQGTTRRGGVGKRQGKNHAGHALRAQLKLQGESDASVDAMVFREYDVNEETDAGRDDERVIHCSVTGRIWYTDDHYATHQEII